MNFQMFKVDLEKAEEPEIKLPTSIESLKKQKSSRKNVYFYFIDYAKDLNCADHNELWKNLQEMGLDVISSIFLFTFCHKGDIICISEVIDISPIFITTCASSSLAFLMMYSACKLNTQGDNIYP